jgi:two-component system, cell cycle sensor histidine kinase and response regulator CckA
VHLGIGTVLVADDDEAMRKVVQRMLSRWGFDTRLASGGADALHQLDDDVVCVILDWKMPGMGGEETLREIRRAGSRAPVILISGYPDAEAASGFRAGELAAFLRKPFRAEALRDTLRDVLATRPIDDP